jgi:hypothetical protein
MTDNELELLRYPTGKFIAQESVTDADIKKWITILEDFPTILRNMVADFSDEMLDTPYRSEGWTARQVIHHLADSHSNAYIRFKLALTEDSPVIKPYKEKLWAELPEAKNAPVDISLDLLDALHRRWVLMIRKMKPEEFECKFINPETKREFTLKTALALYSWHCNHHLGHIQIVKRKFAMAK